MLVTPAALPVGAVDVDEPATGQATLTLATPGFIVNGPVMVVGGTAEITSDVAAGAGGMTAAALVVDGPANPGGPTATIESQATKVTVTAGSVAVGLAAAGRLGVLGGGSLVADGAKGMVVGGGPASNGEVTVGSGGQLAVPRGPLVVGDRGTGDLTVTGGAQPAQQPPTPLSCASLEVGLGTGGHGTVDVYAGAAAGALSVGAGKGSTGDLAIRYSKFDVRGPSNVGSAAGSTAMVAVQDATLTSGGGGAVTAGGGGSATVVLSDGANWWVGPSDQPVANLGALAIAGGAAEGACGGQARREQDCGRRAKRRWFGRPPEVWQWRGAGQGDRSCHSGRKIVTEALAASGRRAG